MRELVVCLTLVAACGDGAGANADARPIGPDAGPMDGTWNLAWTCTQECSGAERPPLTQTTTLVVAGTELTYGGGPGGAGHSAVRDGDCLRVDAGNEDGRARAAYRLCIGSADLRSTIAWSLTHAPTAFTVWNVRAWR